MEPKRGFRRIGESLPPVETEWEYFDPEVRDATCSTGRFVRYGQSLPPIELEVLPASAWPTLVLDVRIAAQADQNDIAGKVADVLIKLLARDRFSGGEGFACVSPPEPSPQGTVRLALISNGPPGVEGEARLRELARAITSPTVEAKVIPAA